MATSVSGNVLRQLPWDSLLLKCLGCPVMEKYKQPQNPMKDKIRERPHGKPWMTADAFIKLLKNEQFQQDMDDLAGQLERVVVAPDGSRVHIKAGT
jgi:hypothetical protein